MTKEKGLLVCGYARVSTENQLENYSIDEQVDRIKAFCKAKGWSLLKIYVDGGYSGGNTDRPALQQMLQLIHKTQVDAVVVYKLDRLSRSQKDTLTLIEDEFLAHNTDFVSINEAFDTSTPFGRAMIGILSVFAQLEKDQITERFAMGRIARGKAGYFHGGGNAPTGYDYIDGKLVVKEYEATIVREIFQRFLSGASINAILRDVQSQYGGSWSAAKVRNILTNSLYIGKVKFAGVEYDGCHSPLISPETFIAARALLFSPEREARFTTSQKSPFRAGYLLSSLVYCTRCGARYSANHGYYRCYSRAKSSAKYIKDPNCKNDNWKIEDLYQAVISQIMELVSSRGFYDQVVSRSQKKKSQKPKINQKSIERRISSIDNQIERLIDLYQVGSISMEIITSKIEALRVEKDVLQGQLQQSGQDDNHSIEVFQENIQRFAANFDTSPLETQRLLISSLAERILIDGQRVEIIWRV